MRVRAKIPLMVQAVMRAVLLDEGRGGDEVGDGIGGGEGEREGGAGGGWLAGYMVGKEEARQTGRTLFEMRDLE